MALDRRAFLRSSAAGAAWAGLAGASIGLGIGAGVGGCAQAGLSHPGAGPRGRGESPFRHGVASGDPLADRVILWTRVSPEESRLGASLEVDWWIARDAKGRDIVARGTAWASPDRDFTLKVDATGLAPNTTYHYGFRCEGAASPVGRTRTLPLADAERFRMALVSCANFAQGFFNAYGCIAAQDDLDLVVHLGDYLYEYGEGQYGEAARLGRVLDPPHEILSLEDYRRRHACYKTDPDLQAAHARHPWITIWDDHESANDSWKEGAENHSPEEGDWSARRLASIRAYTEWMPIRELPRGLFRSFAIGELADLVVVDGRLHARDARVERTDDAGARDPQRSLLGVDQTQWLLDALSASKRRGARWRLVGQPVVFSSLVLRDRPFNADSWDGYRANRGEILRHLASERIDDVIVLTGDVHSAWAIDVPDSEVEDARYDPATGEGARAIELVAPAVSSLPFAKHPGVREVFPDPERDHAHVRYANLEENGWILLDLDRERARAEYLFDGGSEKRAAVCRRGAVLEARAGRPHLELRERTSR